MILDNHGISDKDGREPGDIWEHVKFISCHVLDMRKLSIEWVPKCMNANKKCDHALTSQAILEHFR
jgi:hypothetical protein